MFFIISQKGSLQFADNKEKSTVHLVIFNKYNLPVLRYKFNLWLRSYNKFQFKQAIKNNYFFEHFVFMFFFLYFI